MFFAFVVSLLQLGTAIRVVSGVDVELRNEDPSVRDGPQYTVQLYRDVQPGVCCRSVMNMFPFIHDFEFRGLEAHDIATVWASAELINRCTGRMLQSQVGPGNWLYTTPDENLYGVAPTTVYTATGASYLRVQPNAKGKEAEAAANLEGIKKVTTRGSRRASTSGNSGWRTGISSNSRGGEIRKRDEDAEEEEEEDVEEADSAEELLDVTIVQDGVNTTIYYIPPPRWVWPNLITVNGTNFTETMNGSLTYVDSDGFTLDLESLGKSPPIIENI
ncbi:MAG: hypothetical protein M1827_006674 [Pycnora praestabilis]|nr:MAG: hypothetical protein M1827_006674 [Pycnora praestabilis]